MKQFSTSRNYRTCHLHSRFDEEGLNMFVEIVVNIMALSAAIFISSIAFDWYRRETVD